MRKPAAPPTVLHQNRGIAERASVLGQPTACPLGTDQSLHRQFPARQALFTSRGSGVREELCECVGKPQADLSAGAPSRVCPYDVRRPTMP